jgi:uncharacterized ferritin-like protein (DUF455 family)
MLELLRGVGDNSSVIILERILDDEIRHVEAGSRWFNFLCRVRGMEPVATFAQLLAEYGIGRMKQPLNIPARRLAGFKTEELELLERWAGV